LVEAMICGCPVVSFDCQTGPREILGDGSYGILVPVLDVHGLASGIRSVLQDAAFARKIAELGKARSAAYAALTVVPLWIECLEEVLGLRGRSGHCPEPESGVGGAAGDT
jgi:glycosyltransferase involved in cell wall biosynthesis